MKIAISVPEGLELPEGAEEGSSFDIVANCKLEDGMLVIEALEGVPVSDDEGEDDSEEEKKSEGEDGMVDTPSRQSFLSAVEEKLKSVA